MDGFVLLDGCEIGQDESTRAAQLKTNIGE
jgi:hypothetical protein